ncbi:hypothetical protein [Cypionkella sp. TWP1-2-1b2]|uniref:hypothetical protein n=1 Tax=Cypionkella sp. TWP1-2-1b2 TaxID=2804675 RepID=UPI003CF4DACF
MTHALRVFALTLGRLNLWIAALFLAGLLQHQQATLQTSFADQISAQPVSALTAAPKYALAKPTAPDTRARLIPLHNAAQNKASIPPTGFHLLRSASLPPAWHQPIRHGWQARAPPSLNLTVLI